MRRDARDLSELASPPSSSAGASATSFPSTSPTRLAPCHLHAPLLMRSVTPTASSTFMTSYSRRRFTPRRSASASTGTFPCQLAVDPPPRDDVPDPSALEPAPRRVETPEALDATFASSNSATMRSVMEASEWSLRTYFSESTPPAPSESTGACA